MKQVDHTKFSSGSEVLTKGAVNKRWWLSDKKDIAASTMGIVELIAKNDTRRMTQYQVSARLYGNVPLMGLNGLSFSRMANSQPILKDRISYNVVESAIDTVTAKIAKNKPKPLFLTSGGDYKLQRKAKKLDKFVEGVFYENKAYALGPMIFRDGSILGDGVVHVFEQHGRVKFERVLASELYVDWMESYYGEPRQMHRVKHVDREVLCDLFPKHKGLILSAKSASADMGGGHENVSDQILVVESWRLPSGPDSGDGIHCINIENGNLLVEDYTRTRFPFAFFSWNKRVHGFWSQGLSEQIQSIQLEINKILYIIQRSMHLAGSFKVLMENGSKIVKEHLNNDIGAIVTYTGTPPQYVVPPIVPVEYYNHLQTLKIAAFEQAGVSMLSAASQKPAGLDSGKALREYNNIESDRFMTVGQAYENLFLDLATLTIDCAKEIYVRHGKFEVKVPGRKFIDTIDWKDVDMEEDEYFMKNYPVSSLPNDPEGRLQTVQEYAQAGYMSPRTARKLLDFPDLEQVEDLANSQEEFIHQILEKIVDEGEYTPPEPFDDLALCKELGLEYYSQGKQNGLEEEKLELLRTFIEQSDQVMQQAQAGAQPQGGAQPQALPMAPPQSDLLPTMPQGVQ